MRGLDGRGHGRAHDAQDPGQPAQHLHVHQGLGGELGRERGWKFAARYCATVHCDGRASGAHPRLGGQHERPDGAPGGGRQGRAADAVLQPRHGGGPDPRGRVHQPAGGGGVEDRHRQEQGAVCRAQQRRQQVRRRGGGVQLRVWRAEPRQVVGAGDGGHEPPAAQPLQRRAVVPRRLVQELADVPRGVRLRAAHGAGLHPGRGGARLWQEADDGQDLSSSDQSRQVPAVLHHQ